MDAVNVMKGYDKVDHHEIHSLRRHKLLKATIAISAVILLTLIIGLMVAALIHESNSEEDEQQRQRQQPDAVESIKIVCNVTRNPDSCFTALSSLNISTVKPDPEVILKLSLQVNVKELSNTTALIRSLNDNQAEVALRDCVDQLGDALSRLNDTLSEIEEEKPALTDRKISDIQTWVSAAMTDEETCLDGLEEMGSTVVDEVKSKMKMSKESLSYSLAIIANIQNLLQKFGITMH